MGAIVPLLGQVFSLVWWDDADAAVLGLFDACDQDLFFIVCHKTRDDRMASPTVSVRTGCKETVSCKCLESYYLLVSSYVRPC